MPRTLIPRVKLPNTNRMIGMLGKPKVPLLIRDSDRDGVMNGLDCQPYNPRKQGLRHRLARGAARLIPGKKLREEAVAEITHREQVAEVRRDARREAELESVGDIEKFKIQQREKRKRQFISGGGFFGAAGRGIRGTAVALSKVQPPRTSTTSVVKKAVKARKKGKKGKAKRVTTVSQAPSIPKISDLKFNF